MSDWVDIDEAPHDGTVVRVRRIYEGRVVKDGLAVFDVLHAAAPMRQGLGLDPLGRLSAADYRREAADLARDVHAKHWLLPDRMYKFPTPTQYLPEASP